jgi:archaellum component FlaC
LEVARINQEQQLERLENEKLRLETQYSEVQNQEITLVQELNEKYGAGNLDPETGVFTPTK